MVSPGLVANVVGWLNGTLLLIFRDNTPIKELFTQLARSRNMEITEVTPDEFGREAYEKMKLLTAYLGQYEQRGNDDVQLIISLQPDGLVFTFKKGVTVIIYGFSRDDKTYLLYFSLEEKFIIMTREYVPILEIAMPNQGAAAALNEIFKAGMQGSGKQGNQ